MTTEAPIIKTPAEVVATLDQLDLKVITLSKPVHASDCFEVVYAGKKLNLLFPPFRARSICLDLPKAHKRHTNQQDAKPFKDRYSVSLVKGATKKYIEKYPAISVDQENCHKDMGIIKDYIHKLMAMKSVSLKASLGVVVGAYARPSEVVMTADQHKTAKYWFSGPRGTYEGDLIKGDTFRLKTNIFYVPKGTAIPPNLIGFDDSTPEALIASAAAMGRLTRKIRVSDNEHNLIVDGLCGDDVTPYVGGDITKSPIGYDDMVVILVEFDSPKVLIGDPNFATIKLGFNIGGVMRLSRGNHKMEFTSPFSETGKHEGNFDDSDDERDNNNKKPRAGEYDDEDAATLAEAEELAAQAIRAAMGSR